MSETNKKLSEEEEAKATKQKNNRQVGGALLILGGLFAFSASNVTQSGDASAYAMGAWSVPVICLVLGAIFFFKGGGKII